jgi:hypothetical protein
MEIGRDQKLTVGKGWLRAILLSQNKYNVKIPKVETPGIKKPLTTKSLGYCSFQISFNCVDLIK